MKNIKKSILSVLILFYLGITITITIPEETAGEPAAQTYQLPVGTEGGLFDEGDGTNL